MIPRAATSPELTKLRSNDQRTRLFLIVDKPTTVYSARINQTFSSHDKTDKLSYDGGSGTLANVKPGMTMLIGSSAGAHDKGRVRIRKTPSADLFEIGITSDIDFADNDYLTVIDAFEPWARHWDVPSATELYMDTDVEYTDQNADCDPIPVMGPDAVVELTGASITHDRSGADSWCPGSTITGYAWTVTGTGGSVANASTDAPTFTFTAGGRFVIALTVTAANGKTTTGYRYTYVVPATGLPTTFETRSVVIDSEKGSSFKVRLFDAATLADIRDGARVLVYAKDTYGGVAGSVGFLTGYENVVTWGWIDGETINYNPVEGGLVEFQVNGILHWLNEMPVYPAGLKDTAATPTDWRFFEGLTLKAALWNLAHWRSTLSLIVDLDFTDDAREPSALTSNAATLFEQLKEIAGKLTATIRANRYNQIIVEVDTQLTAEADRTSIPVVMDITRPDWAGIVQIERSPRPRVSQIEASGVDSTGNPLFSRATGSVMSKWGVKGDSVDNLIIQDQSELNILCGLLYTRENNPYQMIPIELAQNNRMIDVAGNQYLTLSMAADDNTRGITWTNQKIIPRRVEFLYDSKAGVMKTSIECVADTLEGLAVTVIPPGGNPEINLPPIDIGQPGYPLFPPPTTWYPPVVPVEPPASSNCLLGTAGTGPFQLWPNGLVLDSRDVNKLTVEAYLHGVARAYSVEYKSVLVVPARPQYLLGNTWFPSNLAGAVTCRLLDQEKAELLKTLTEYDSEFLNSGFPETNTSFWIMPTDALEFHGLELEIYQPPTPGVWNKNFDFALGAQGWEGTPYDSGYPAGFVGVPCSAHARGNSSYWRWWAGKLETRSYAEGDDAGPDMHMIWVYKPDRVYAVTGAAIQVIISDWPGGFYGFGAMFTDGTSVGVNDYSNGTKTATVGAPNNGKKVAFFYFDFNRSGTTWAGIDNFGIANFTSDIEAYRLVIDRADLYNICAASDMGD